MSELKTDAEYIVQFPDSLPLRAVRASIIGQIALAKENRLMLEEGLQT